MLKQLKDIVLLNYYSSIIQYNILMLRIPVVEQAYLAYEASETPTPPDRIKVYSCILLCLLDSNQPQSRLTAERDHLDC